MRKNSGFTVMELVVVIAVIGVMTAIAIPSFLSWIPEKRLRSAGDDLFSNLLYTKMQAIKNNATWGIFFNTSSDSYQIFSGPGNDNIWTNIADNPLVKTVVLAQYGSGVRFGRGNATKPIPGDGSIPSSGVSYPTSWVFFDSRGMVSDTGNVYLTNDFRSAVGAGTPVLAGVVSQKVWKTSDWE